MPYCHRCGTKLEENAHFCQKCGTPVVTLPPPTPASTITYPTTPPNRNNSLLLAIMIVVAIVIAVIIIGAIIFLVFHMSFGQTNSSQPNTNSLYILDAILHKQTPWLNPQL